MIANNFFSFFKVLATDNAKHMNILGSLKTMVETKKLSEATMRPVQLESFNEKMHVLKCLVHCADLSNPTRPLPMYETWVERLMEEFFRQVRALKNELEQQLRHWL